MRKRTSKDIKGGIEGVVQSEIRRGEGSASRKRKKAEKKEGNNS